MTEISDQDWEQLNAWIDGELPGDAVEAVAARVASDPDWAAAAASLREVSTVLRAMQPETAPTSVPVLAANQNSRPWKWIAAVSVAAALTFVAVFSGVNRSLEPGDIHRSYLAQEFNVAAIPSFQRVSEAKIDGFPGLGEANLSLVATRSSSSDKGIASAHYVGVNGCRLTVLRGADLPHFVANDLQIHTWETTALEYQAIATGMDVGKFAAIVAYLKQATRGVPERNTVVALQGAVETAVPCA